MFQVIGGLSVGMKNWSREVGDCWTGVIKSNKESRNIYYEVFLTLKTTDIKFLNGSIPS